MTADTATPARRPSSQAREAFPSMAGRTILQVIPELSAGGAERTVLEMAEAIIHAGGVPLVASRGGRMARDLIALGGELIEMDAKSKNPLTLRANAARLARLITARNVDVIHARSRAPAWSAYWAARRTSIPFITTYHGAYSARSKAKLLYNSVMAKGDRVIANSEWTANAIRETYGLTDARLVTIPRGVDLLAFDPENVSPARIAEQRESWDIEGDDALVLLMPGRLTDWKGHGLAIEALESMAPDEKARLWLVFMGDDQGRTDYVMRLVDSVAAAGLNDRVRFKPHVSDMPAAYAAADIVLCPSTRPEAFGRTAAEAGAMACPVIASDHGGARETVIDGETGARFEPGDARALAGAIRTLICLPAAARAEMGAAGRAHVTANFSKRGLQLATLRVYSEVMTQKTGP